MDSGLLIGVVAALIVMVLVRSGSALDRDPRSEEVRQQAEARGFRTQPDPMEALQSRMPSCVALAQKGPEIDSYWEISEGGRWLIFAEMYRPDERRGRHGQRALPEHEFTVVCARGR